MVLPTESKIPGKQTVVLRHGAFYRLEFEDEEKNKHKKLVQYLGMHRMKGEKGSLRANVFQVVTIDKEKVDEAVFATANDLFDMTITRVKEIDGRLHIPS